MENEVNKLKIGEQPINQANFLSKLLVAIYIIAYVMIALLLFVDGWIHNHSLIRSLFTLSPDEEFPLMFSSALFTCLGSILGCGVLAMVSFHNYVAYECNFQTSHIWGYFGGPLLAMVLGLIVFALLQSGLLIFSSGPPVSEQTDTTNLGYLAIGFLSGFGWYRVTKRIERLVARVFTGTKLEEDVGTPGNLDR